MFCVPSVCFSSGARDECLVPEFSPVLALDAHLTNETMLALLVGGTSGEEGGCDAELDTKVRARDRQGCLLKVPRLFP